MVRAEVGLIFPKCTGSWSQVRPWSRRPAAFLLTPPHCLRRRVLQPSGTGPVYPGPTPLAKVFLRGLILPRQSPNRSLQGPIPGGVPARAPRRAEFQQTFGTFGTISGAPATSAPMEHRQRRSDSDKSESTFHSYGFPLRASDLAGPLKDQGRGRL